MNLQHRKILIAPLDWGMGHTTRCVPLIRNLLAAGHLVTVAGNEWQRQHIKEIFGNINFIHLDGYDIAYARTALTTKMHLLQSVPGIRSAIAREHLWLQQAITALHPDLIISDNRYGIYHHAVPSVIITHQLAIQTGLGNTANNMLQQLHYRMLRPFQQVWVPDVATGNGLGNRLSHPATLPPNTHYIGLLSQFETDDMNCADHHLLVLLSGPEPQRTMLAQILWQQLLHYTGKVVFVEGFDNAVALGQIPDHITYHKRLSGSALQSVISCASMVICRSGYSSVMDLLRLQCKAILIPTPGQTEQEYLGKIVHENGLFYSTDQNGFHLAQALANAAGFPFRQVFKAEDFNVFAHRLTTTLNDL